MGVFAFSFFAKAQSIRVVEDPNRTKPASLDGKAVAVFVANADNMFIETSRPSLDVSKGVKKNSAGEYEYTIELQLQTQEGSASARSFTITQAGSANKTTFKKGKFQPNQKYYFIVETVKNPIFLVDNTQPTDVHLKNNEAAIEINSLAQIDVTVDPKLSCEVTSSHTQAGYYSTLVVVDMKKLNEMRSEVERQQMLYNDVNETLLDRAEHNKEVRDSDWARLQMIQERKEESEAELAEAYIIRIKAEDSNELVIDITDLQVKQKRVYTVEISGMIEEDEFKPHWMLLANYGYGFVGQHSLGLTLAWAGRFGGYLNVMTNGSFLLATDQSASMSNQSDYLWSSKTAKTRLLVTAGGLFAVKKAGYVYAGAGYGIRNLVWWTVSDQSVAMSPGTYKGVALETGMFFNLWSHALVSVGGVIQFPGPYYEAKVGVGYKF
jgi:hypothetical protein